MAIVFACNSWDNRSNSVLKSNVNYLKNTLEWGVDLCNEVDSQLKWTCMFLFNLLFTFFFHLGLKGIDKVLEQCLS